MNKIDCFDSRPKTNGSSSQQQKEKKALFNAQMDVTEAERRVVRQEVVIAQLREKGELVVEPLKALARLEGSVRVQRDRCQRLSIEIARPQQSYTAVVSQPSPATFEFTARNDQEAARAAAEVIKQAIDDLDLDSEVTIFGAHLKIGEGQTVEQMACLSQPLG